MRVTRQGDTKRIILDPGEYHATREPVMLSTLLGSCVAACIYDPVQRVFGMNHFLLANKRYAKDIPVVTSDAGRYGIHAMELLINSLLRQGAKRANLKAKAFGGANVLGSHAPHDNFFAVGDINSRFIIEFLRQERIPLISSDLGGRSGRMVHFKGKDFSVLMRKIGEEKVVKIEKTERSYWQKSIKEQEKEEIKPPQEAEFW